MKFRATKLGVLALILLAILAAVQSRHLAERRRAGLPAAYQGYSGSELPPALNMLLLGLGGFRGIAAEVLWLRADRLQEEGRYMELVQLADWITRLDPHAAEAWVYNAWNLAYNVSSMMIRPADRARWVANGVSLLRDEGLRYNPKEARLYRELAWFYQNKIGDSLDDAHLEYKLDLVAEMSPMVRADGTLLDTPATRKLLSDLRLDASRMAALESRFGPLDWRVAESHAIYWASLGVEFARDGELLMCRRGVYQPLLLSVFRGRFIGFADKRQWLAAPNFALAESAAVYLEETLEKNPSRTQRDVLLRYLALAAQRTAQAGLAPQSQRLYERLCKHVPSDLAKPTLDQVIKGWEPPNEH